MISEKDFSRRFSSFWGVSLPNLGQVVRALNADHERFDLGVATENAPARRDIISEVGFQILAQKLRGGAREMSVDEAIEKAVDEISMESEKRRTPAAELTRSEISESEEISEKIKRFIDNYLDGRSMKINPDFKGHGIIHSCKGDLSDHKTLVEVKYVNRGLKSIDIRQCLTYCGLAYLGHGIEYQRILVFNPFKGVLYRVGVDEMVASCSGRSFVEFVHDMSYAVAAGELSR